MIYLVVHADDFGHSDSRNVAINDCFMRHWLSETSVMVNMPCCDAAVKMSKTMGYSAKVGIHLNLTEGVPLTNGILNCPRFCDQNGRFNARFHKTSIGRFALTKEESHCVRNEIEAQFDKFTSYDGLMRKIDSHHHVHTDWSIFKLVVPLANRYGFKSMRLSADVHKVNMRTWLYKKIFNAIVRKNFNTTDHFDGINDLLLSLDDGVVEVMVHPRMCEGKLFDYKTPFESSITKLTKNLNVKIVSWED